MSVKQATTASNGVRVAIFAAEPGSGNGRALRMAQSLAEAGYRPTLYTDASGVALCPQGVEVECCLTLGDHDTPVTLSRVPDLTGMAVVQACGRELLRQVTPHVPESAKLIYDVPTAEPLPVAPEGAGLRARGRSWLAGIKSSVGAWRAAPRIDAAICPSYIFGEFLQREMKLKQVPVVPIYPALPLVDEIVPDPEIWADRKRPVVAVLGGDFADLEAAIHAVARVRELDLMVVNGHGDWQVAEDMASGYRRMAGRLHRVDVSPERVLGTIAGCELGMVLPLDSSQQALYDIPAQLFVLLMAGVPVVASDLPGLERLVLAQNFGLLADPEDLEQVANQVGRAWSDRPNHERLVYNVDLVRRHRYSWEVQATRLLTLYAQLTVVTTVAEKA